MKGDSLGTRECMVWYLLFMLCLVISVGYANLAFADTSNPWALPAISITADGTINPSDAPIGRIQDTYFLTESITEQCIQIQRGNITLDGMGNTLRGKGEWFESPGILINANGVTVKNITITKYGGAGIGVNGSGNTITQNTIISNNAGVSIEGRYNEVTRNIDLFDGVNIYRGEFNNITYNGNKPFKVRVEPDASNNVVLGNNLTRVELYGNYNTFYLNNFYNKYISDNIFLSNPPDKGNRLDNATVGNFWAGYNGADNNNDGIGDTPLIIAESISDRYPITTPINLTAIIPTPSDSPKITSSPTIPEIPSWKILTLLIAVFVSIIILRKGTKRVG